MCRLRDGFRNKEMKKILLFILPIFFFKCAISSPPVSVFKSEGLKLQGEKIAIVEITGYNSQQIENELSIYLLSLGVDVLERIKLNRLLEEQKLSLSGLIDNQKAVELGKMVGAKYVIIANTTNPTVSNVAHFMDNTWQTYVVTFTARITDVTSGKIVMGGSATGKRGYPNYAVSDAIKLFFEQK